MEYEDAIEACHSAMAFTKTQKQTLDGRKKKHNMARDQMDSAYRNLVVARNHLRVARRMQYGDEEEIT